VEVKKIKSTILAALLCAVPAHAGPEWEESLEGDAGALPFGAQRIYGNTPIDTINGCLESMGCISGLLGGDPTDYQDMFVLEIADPANFCATTVGPMGGAGFDTTLFLFALDGSGLLGNDNTPVLNLDDAVMSGSTLDNTSNDGTGIVITEPGLYLLAITVFPNVPLDDNGDPIFIFREKGEQSGPEEGGGPIDGWVDATGACCVYFLEVGVTCEELTADECESLAGLYLGDFVECDGGDACPDPTGACCFYGEPGFGVTCEELTEADCLQDGGSYLGDFVTCNAGEACPEPTGGCCFYGTGFKGPTCEELTELDCLQSAGVYLGDFVDCEGGAACPPPTGACCYNEALFTSCEVMTADECGSLEGEYLGDFIDCDPKGDCPLPTGACCFFGLKGGCSVLTEVECSDSGGSYIGDGTVCATDGKCPPTGACCFEDKGGDTCFETTEALCIELFGAYRGDFTSCVSPTECPPPTGACCFDFDGMEFCEILTELDCLADSGTYEGDGVDCGPLDYCPGTVIGACCLFGDCQLLSEIDCLNFGGDYVGDGTECDPSGACGACCLMEAPFCEIVPPDTCSSLGGFYQGNGSGCVDCKGNGPDNGFTGGLYSISLCGVMPAETDCNNNQIGDTTETTPDFDPGNLNAAAQDLCENADWICPGVYNGDSTGAGAGDLLSCGLYYGTFDVFYKYRPKYDGLAFVSVAGPPSQWLVSIHTACPATDANMIACSSPALGNVTFDVDRGQTYWIRTAAVGAATGPFVLSLVGPDCAPSAVDLDANGVPDDCDCPTDVFPQPKPDGTTNLGDYITVVAALGPCAGCPEDIDMSGVVDATDLQLVLIELNTACPGPPVPNAPQWAETP
jgi:hypothetical protein